MRNIRFLNDLDWVLLNNVDSLESMYVPIRMWLPEIAALRGVEQPVRHHPEGDVWTHTLQVVQCTPKDRITRWAALFHDSGKLHTQGINNRGDICFHNHEDISAEIVREVLRDFKFVEDVAWLVQNHMRMHVFFEMKKTKQYHLASDPRFPLLLYLHRADRPEGNYIAIREWYKEKKDVFALQAFNNEYYGRIYATDESPSGGISTDVGYGKRHEVAP